MFKVEEHTWLDEPGKVKHLKSRKMDAWVAYNEKPPMICIPLTKEKDDLGRQKDLVIDIKSLVKELVRTGVIKQVS